MKIHPTSEISHSAKIGKNTQIWHHAQIRENAKIGENCIIGKGVYIDKNVVIGDKVKIQNYASLYHGTLIENGVFIGPYVCITNDLFPRAITPDGKLKSDKDWVEGKITIGSGASLGAGTIVIPNVEIGEFAMIGAGSLVTEDIPSQALAYGHPAKVKGYVCKCATIISRGKRKPNILQCKLCLSKNK